MDRLRTVGARGEGPSARRNARSAAHTAVTPHAPRCRGKGRSRNRGSRGGVIMASTNFPRTKKRFAPCRRRFWYKI
jgi:hypothetical protein